MHKKLFEAYSEFDYLLGDIKEEVSDGAPLPWEELGEGRGTWSPDRQADLVDFFISRIKESAK